MRNVLFIFMAGLLFSHCSMFSGGRGIMSKGGLAENVLFYEEFDYEDFNGWILVKASINSSAERSFLFDTGAPMVLTDAFAAECNVRMQAQTTFGTSSSTGQRALTGMLKTVRIGNTTFKNIGTLVTNFGASPDMQCLNRKVDGIIGCNLMRHAVWHLDYQRKKIIMTNQPECVPAYQQTFVLPFLPNRQGTPHVRTNLPNGKTLWWSIDTGKKGGLTIGKNYRNDLKNKIIDEAVGVGIVSSGVAGLQRDTLHSAVITKLPLDSTMTIDTAIVHFRRSNFNLIGNAFLSKYNLTLDWATNEMALSRNETGFPAFSRWWEYQSFGLEFEWKLDTVTVGFLYEGGSAAEAGLEIGDQVLRVNNQTLQINSLDNYCEAKTKGLLPTDAETAVMVVRKKAGGLRRVTLKNQLLFQHLKKR